LEASAQPRPFDCAILRLIPRITRRQSILRAARDRRLTPSAKLDDPHPINPLGDHDLGMLTIANIATPARPLVALA
jgi:hypothetical protein